MSRVYDDLETMLADRGVRRRDDGSFAEDSYDYGVWWRDGADVYRLTWIGPQMRDDPAKVGELYLVRLSGPFVGTILSTELGSSWAPGDHLDVLSAGGPSGRVELLCTIAPAEEEELEPVAGIPVVRRPRVDERVEEILGAWGDACGGENSVAWVRERVRLAIAQGLASDVQEGATR